MLYEVITIIEHLNILKHIVRGKGSRRIVLPVGPFGLQTAEKALHVITSYSIHYTKLYDIATNDVFEYIEVFYNRQRRHASLGYVSPEAFEKRHPAAATPVA